ncbi:MAG: MarR family transcriptional regulator [Candidatus Thorarchaeota archaeon]
MQTENDFPPILRRTLIASIEYLGIQRSAIDILFVLYLEKLKNQPSLSISEIVQKSGLSLSSVSSLCSRLEAEGILTSRNDDSRAGRGRRKILYEFNMGLDELLKLGIRKYLREVGRICRDIKMRQKKHESDDGIHKDLLNCLEAEICSFLSGTIHIASEISPQWIEAEINEDVDLDKKLVESAI